VIAARQIGSIHVALFDLIHATLLTAGSHEDEVS
jgi:hypothetical protein